MPGRRGSRGGGGGRGGGVSTPGGASDEKFIYNLDDWAVRVETTEDTLRDGMQDLQYLNMFLDVTDDLHEAAQIGMLARRIDFAINPAVVDISTADRALLNLHTDAAALQ